jgi:hypothetical protein
VNPKKEDTLNILNNILELNEKKALCIQNQVQLEIESFINNNLKEMYKNLDELKQSYEKEIKLMEGSYIIMKKMGILMFAEA